MTVPRQPTRDQGFVMVPVIVLLVVALGLGFALLTIVDTQTGQSRSQRSSDAAQTLAEGVAAVAANVLADDPSPTTWTTTGGCGQVTGDLTTPPTGSTSVADQVIAQVQKRFEDSSPDYASAGRGTTWKVNICPVMGTENTDRISWNQNVESRWSDTFLTRNITAQPAGTPPAQVSLWLRGQASVGSVGTSATQRPRVRAVATKVRQSNVTFQPPKDFAVGTGVFSTDVGTGLNTALTNNNALVGGLLNKTLGTTPLIADSNSTVGVRCGLLNTLNNPSSVCLSGAFAGLGEVTNALGAGILSNVLGTNRTKSLGNWTMAPDDAVAAYKAAAQAQGGIYKDAVPGSGNVKTKDVGNNPDASPCYTEPSNANTVVYIAKVGNGDQYCTVSGTTTAKILIVERGGIRITGSFTGVVYALNKQECTGDDGACSDDDRKNAAAREVVRIEGNTGKVNGSVWADGAAGAVGIYPSLNPAGVNSSALLNVGNPANGGICGIPVVGPLLNVVGGALNGVVGLVGKILGLEQVRYPGGGSAPSGCDLLRAQLGGLSSNKLLDLFSTGGDQSIVVSEHKTRNCLLFCGWSDWTPRDTQSVNLPSLLSQGTPDVLSQVSGLLAGTLGGYSAITYNAGVVDNAKAQLSVGGGPVVGSYRNIAPN